MQRELVERARTGDRDAFTAIASASYARLQGIARLILRDDDLAADAAQEALISAWRHIRAVCDPSRFEAWLYRLVVHASYREARRTRRSKVRELQASIPEVASSDDHAETVARKDQLENGFRRLSVEHRSALVVHHYLGLPDAEAAAVLGTRSARSSLDEKTRPLAWSPDGLCAAPSTTSLQRPALLDERRWIRIACH